MGQSYNLKHLGGISEQQEVDLAVALPSLIAAGFPTFDEYRKNPDKWRKRPDEILESADQSTKAFKHIVKKQKYFWRDSKNPVESLEKIERICREEGIDRASLEMEPRVFEARGGKVEIHIRFWPPGEWALKGKVSTNG